MGLELPEVEGMLIMEVDGHREAVKEQIKSITDICSSAGGFDIRWSDDPRERGKIWAARAGLVSALSRYKEGYRLIPISEDFGVPVSKIPEAIKETQKISKKHDIIIAAFGHVGDGNLHTTFIIDVRHPLEWKKVKVVGQELIELAIRLGGTVTAEHGTGIARARFIKRELGNAHELMRKIKRSLDPNNILNPGKMGLRGRIPDILDYFAFADLIEKPGEVRSFSKFIDNEILACIQCGFCRAACPVFEQKAIESTNARGKVLLGYSLLTNRAEPSDALAERFYQCTTCMNCTQQCPAGIKVVDIVERLRAELVGKGFIPPEHKQIRENILQFHNPFGESAAPRVELQRLSLAGR
jgi:glycolate oxidase